MTQISSNVDGILDISSIFKILRASTLVSKETQWLIYKVALVLSDIFMINLAMRLAYFFRFEVPFEFFAQSALVSFDYYQQLVFLSQFLWLLIFWINGLYQQENLLRGSIEYDKIFRSSTVGFLLVVVAGFFQPDLEIARAWLLMSWLFSFLFASFGRLILRRIIHVLRNFGFYLSPAIIVGANKEGEWLAKQIKAEKTSGLYLVGFIDDNVPTGTVLYGNLINLGTITQIDEIVEKYGIGDVILSSSVFQASEYLIKVFNKYGGVDNINLHLSSGIHEIIATGLTFNESAFMPLVRISKVKLSGSEEFLKLILDYAITVTGLIVISPILLLSALLIKMTSPGPILYKRKVMGQNGKHFSALKFRTISTRDGRVTRIGAFLRKYSLDELPQLFNVLTRDMSLVGPRMISPEEFARYYQPNASLLATLPGITGLWQVSGRPEITYEDRVRLDMYYVRNWNIWLDLQLLFQTIPAVYESCIETESEAIPLPNKVQNAKSIKKPKIKVSIAFPQFLSKRYASHFKVRIYPEQLRDKVQLALVIDNKEKALLEQEYDSELQPGTKIELKLQSPVVDFSEPIIDVVKLGIRTTSFTGIPKDGCSPGIHAAVLTITDPETKIQYSDISFNVLIRDYAFDHVSRPMLSNMSTVLLSVASLITFLLTLMGQVDQTFGYASGTTVALIAAFLQARIQMLYRSPSKNVSQP